jgi:acetoin utilization deacetylase AcuC-like enzyme
MTTGFYTHSDCKRHDMGPWHPECPARLQAIEDQLIASRINEFLEHREAPEALLEDIARVHTGAAIARIHNNIPPPSSYYPLDGDTSLNAYSFACRRRGSGGDRCSDRRRTRQRFLRGTSARTPRHAG